MPVRISSALTSFLGIALAISYASASADDWIDVRTPRDLQVLFSNKTFRTHEKWHGWIAHFRDDGKGIQKSVIAKADNSLFIGSPLPREWKIKGMDQVCITSLDTSAVNCYKFRRHRKIRNEFTMTNVSTTFVVSITVEDGIPAFE